MTGSGFTVHTPGPGSSKSAGVWGIEKGSGVFLGDKLVHGLHNCPGFAAQVGLQYRFHAGMFRAAFSCPCHSLIIPLCYFSVGSARNCTPLLATPIPLYASIATHPMFCSTIQYL
jgi:hypothetical protein